MSAMDELRRMLDERGIEWHEAGGVTYFETSGYDTRYAASEPECGIALDPLTPKQVIAATVERETCHMELLPDEPTTSIQPMRCTACGHKTYAQLASFCPRCGRKVVE